VIATRERTAALWVSDDVVALAGERPRAGRVTARFDTALHAEVGGFVVAVLPPAAPRMPNGVSVDADALGDGSPAVGDPALLTRDGLRAGALTIGWDAESSERFDARVPRWTAEERRGLATRAEAILGAAPGGARVRLLAEALAHAGGFGAHEIYARAALESLLAAVRSGDPRDAARAGRELVGRGPGLTPAGDDVLAAAALTVAAAAYGWPRGRHAWLAALLPSDLRRRTTRVSATLLELAVRGRGFGPARALLDPRRHGDGALRDELAALARLGHTSGAAYAATIGAVALVLAPDENDTNHDKENR
jgi:hypothetical protein